MTILGPQLIMGTWQFFLAMLLAAFTSSTRAAAQDIPAPPAFAKVKELAIQGIRAGLAPGISVAVVKDDELVWAEGFGYADIEQKRRATSDSIYRLASISKPITATGLMILAERGKIELDRAANDYLPRSKLRAWRGSARDMTIRRLLNHSSGLPLHYNFFYDGVQAPSMDETIRRYGFAATRPGTEFQYSNLAFGILGYITGLVAGEPWAEFLRRELFDPTGMTRTAPGIRKGREADATAQYMSGAAGNFVRVGRYEFDHPGASALWSSARDLVRFARLHYRLGEFDGVRVLRSETAKAMQRMTWQRPGGRGLGLAWMLANVKGHRCYYHSGGMPGVAAFLRVFPDDRAVSVVLTNTSNRTMYRRLTDAITSVLFPEAPETRPFPSGGNEASPAPGELSGTWSGKLVHWQDGPVPIRLVVTGESATLRLGEGRALPLRGLRITKDRLLGSIDGLLFRTQDGFHGRPRLEFQLRRDGESLSGVCVARAEHYFALSHWVKLERAR